MTIAPWLNVSPTDFLRAGAEGTDAGLRLQSMLQSRQENDQRMQMEQSAQGRAAQQNAAEMAFRQRQAAIQNQLAQQAQAEQIARTQAEQQRMIYDANLNATQTGRRLDIEQQNADSERMRYSAPKIIKQKDGSVISVDAQGNVTQIVEATATNPKLSANEYVGVKSDDGKTTMKVPASSYEKFLDDTKKWQATAPPETVPGELWGSNPNPDYASFSKTNAPPVLTDYLTPKASFQSAPPASPAAATDNGLAGTQAALQKAGWISAPTDTGTSGSPQPAPPKEQREVGKTYSTPKGMFTWTADGWVAAQ